MLARMKNHTRRPRAEYEALYQRITVEENPLEKLDEKVDTSVTRQGSE